MIQKSLHIVNQVRRAFKDPEMQKVYDLFRECEVRTAAWEGLEGAFKRGYVYGSQVDTSCPYEWNTHQYAAWSAGLDVRLDDVRGATRFIELTWPVPRIRKDGKGFEIT
jgi:hypothetical protein